MRMATGCVGQDDVGAHAVHGLRRFPGDGHVVEGAKNDALFAFQEVHGGCRLEPQNTRFRRESCLQGTGSILSGLSDVNRVKGVLDAALQGEFGRAETEVHVRLLDPPNAVLTAEGAAEPDDHFAKEGADGRVAGCRSQVASLERALEDVDVEVAVSGVAIADAVKAALSVPDVA